ncbi:hypothetical protein LCGC14_2712400, partial [marine sediment metagenome]
IDPHEGIPYYHPEPTYNDFMVKINTAKVVSQIQVKKGTSEESSSEITEKISLLFIDGDHTYEMVKKDFSLYEKKIIDRGYIALHDAVLEGPFKVILEAIKSNQWEFLQIIGNLALIRKKLVEENNDMNILTILNLILLHINRQFHLNFVENDEISMKVEVKELLINLERKL